MIRFRLNLTEANLSCDFDEDLFHQFFQFLDKLQIEGISYIADATIDVYSDESLPVLQKFVTEYNGADFHGVPIEIESAKGIIVSLNIVAEHYKQNDENNFEVFYHNKLKLYFDNFYDMSETLVKDIETKLMTNDSALIFAFFKQWYGYENDVGYYLAMLPRSNRVRVYTDTVLLMDKEPRAYTPGYERIYTHDCKQYPSGTCLA